MGAVSVSLCGEQAIVVCKAIKEADGRIHFEFEYVSLEQAVVDEKMLLRAVRDATLLKRGTRVVVRTASSLHDANENRFYPCFFAPKLSSSHAVIRDGAPCYCCATAVLGKTANSHSNVLTRC